MSAASRAPASEPRNLKHIVVVKPSSLGDIVHTLPAVALIKRRWAEARLSWIINPEWAPLLEGNPFVDEIVVFPRSEFRGLRGLLKVPGWARELGQRLKADLVLDFQCLLRSALIARRCRSSDGRVYGLSDGREGSKFLYDEVIDVRGKAHAVDRYLAVVEALGISADRTQLEWPLPQGPKPAGELPERFILLHPFSRGAGKSMSVEDVGQFCRAVAPHKVVIAGRTEETLAPTDNTVDLLNKTSLAELIWLIRHADFVVSVDSGPMHIAAAITPRLVSIHTWSDPLKVGPYNDEASVWQNGRLRTIRQLRAGEKGTSIEGVAGLSDWILKHVS